MKHRKKTDDASFHESVPKSPLSPGKKGIYLSRRRRGSPVTGKDWLLVKYDGLSLSANFRILVVTRSIVRPELFAQGAFYLVRNVERNGMNEGTAKDIRSERS